MHNPDNLIVLRAATREASRSKIAQAALRSLAFIDMVKRLPEVDTSGPREGDATDRQDQLDALLCAVQDQLESIYASATERVS